MAYPDIPSSLQVSAWTLESLAAWPAYEPDLALLIEAWERGELVDQALGAAIYRLAVNARRLADRLKRNQNVEIVRKRQCRSVDKRAEEWKDAVRESRKIVEALEENLDINQRVKAETIQTFLLSMVEPTSSDETKIFSRRRRAKVYLYEQGLHSTPWGVHGKFHLAVWLGGVVSSEQPECVRRYVRSKIEQLRTWMILGD